MDIEIDMTKFKYDERRFRFSNHKFITHIYGLFDIKKPSCIRYIGKADCLKKRLEQHIKEALKIDKNTGCFTYKTHRDCWIRKVLKQSQLDIVLIKWIPQNNWRNIEIAYISEFKKLGCKLTNITNGGEGGKLNDAAKKKLSNTMKIKYKNEIHPLKNCKLSDAHKEKIRKSKLGSVRDIKSKIKQSKSSRQNKSIWINNGFENKYHHLSKGAIPIGWEKGRIFNWPKRNYNVSDNTKQLISKIQKGKIWITNGIINKFIYGNVPMPDGFMKGKIVKPYKKRSNCSTPK